MADKDVHPDDCSLGDDDSYTDPSEIEEEDSDDREGIVEDFDKWLDSNGRSAAIVWYKLKENVLNMPCDDSGEHVDLPREDKAFLAFLEWYYEYIVLDI
jgi:hypothetical protein